MKKITILKTVNDMEELLNRMLGRITKLEEDVRLLDVEIGAMSDLIVNDEEVDN